MKKSSKIISWTSAVVVVLATAGTLLGVFIPQWLNNNKLTNLVKNQVKPSEGNGNYLQYSLKNAVDSNAGSLQSIEQFVKKSLTTDDVSKNISENLVSNYITELFRNFKSSDSYANRYKTWNDEINEQWDELVKSYRTRHGDLWEFYFQTEILDQAGGNEADWKRNKLFNNVNTAFDELMFQELHLSAMRNGSPIPVTTTPTKNLEEYLFSPDFVGSTAKAGTPNQIQFVPSTIDSTTSVFTKAIANFQSFVFDEYVKNTLPIVTSMVLFKHTAPQTDGKSDFFNVAKAKQIYDPNNATDIVGADASYTWQTFPVSQSIIDSPDGTAVWNATDKYLNFVKNRNNHIKTDIGGAINIPVTNYTDDSATLYYIKAADVFASSYAQYSAAATYKFNTDVLGHTADANVPTATAFKNAPLATTSPATEIMSNFMKTTTNSKGYFQLPKQVTDIINNDGTSWTGRYNGIKEIADTVNVTGSPFIMTRDEAGVHIIGIDRYDAIKAAVGEDKKLIEIKNTILWRHILTEFGLGKNTGFNLDLQSELKTYYDSNKLDLIYQYILKNEVTSADSDSYLFSSVYTDVSGLAKLADGIYHEYVNAWIDYRNYQSKLSHKTTVVEKILGIQTSYTEKLYGNSVIQNGIAGVLPYTRTTKLNDAPKISDKGIVNDVYGNYPSLSLYQGLEATDTGYTELEAQAKLKNIETTLVDALFDELAKSNISYKNLTFSSAKYSQYLLLGISTDIKSNTEFMNDGDILNAAVTSWIAKGDSKDQVIVEKIISDINYDSKAHSSPLLNADTWALANTYTINNDVAVLSPAPTAIPAAANATAISTYVNYYLQQAYETKKIVPNYLSELNANMQSDWSLAGIRTTARNLYFSELLKDPSGDKAITHLKDIAALKVALDYNTTTDTYDLTKFRDYLLDQTNNYKKAAFVWSSKEKIDLLAPTNGVKNQYTFKKYNVTKINGVNGYKYQGAAPISAYKDTNGIWNADVTFNDTNEYFESTKLDNQTADSFIGYNGMQFENESSGSLSSDIKSSIFSGSTTVYDGYDVKLTNAPSANTIKIKGVLYNIGSRQDFQTAIEQLIFNWSQLNSLTSWLNTVFNISTSGISRTDLNEAKKQVIAIVADAGQLPEEVFERNEKSLLVNKNYSTVQPGTDREPFYFPSSGDENNPYFSTAVFTQFNQKDVIELFDTNTDGLIDDKDVGINWTVAADPAKQFLGTSAEAFFNSAIAWYMNQTTVVSSAYDSVLERQGKTNVYDRRLNDQFGEDLVANYKKTPSTESD